MITRIEINGFKSFHEFGVNLRPFQVLIGPNGAGKSNLFDAIVLLSHLAGDHTLYDAFRQSRGEITELFTIFPDGTRSNTMQFAVEMLIGKQVADVLGITAKVSSNRLRYELHIDSRTENGFERLYVIHESLTAITGSKDKWYPIIPNHKQKGWIKRGRRAPYISTSVGMIFKHQDGRSGAKQGTPIGRIEKTLLSTINSAEYPTAYAARQEILSWRFLQFNPMELRTPCGVYAPKELLPDGSNLPAVLYRMSREEDFALVDVSRDMVNIVPGILEIAVRPVAEREEFLINANMQDGSTFSSRVLSDGTLRLLALVTLKHDPLHRGVLCFEEPENGVHPERLQSLVNVLKSIVTNFEDDEAGDSPKQVLVNTHSPRLMELVDIEQDLLFVYMSGSIPRATRMVPVEHKLILSDDTSDWERRFTSHQVASILSRS